MSVNKVILIGNVGKDPEIRHLDSGVAVANFPLATSETYTAKNGDRVTSTEWHNIVLWRGLADIAEKYVKKGMQLFIEGRIRSRSYDDKDGNKRYITEIYGDSMRMLTSRENSAGASPSGDNSANEPQNGSNYEEPQVDNNSSEEDDLPF
ncbi:MAG: single-stranded DNA-binding protein [Draconibacterium sp.]|nr:MAG: single-stranded DNA-binding protein [Draconibacterium sp.]